MTEKVRLKVTGRYRKIQIRANISSLRRKSSMYSLNMCLGVPVFIFADKVYMVQKCADFHFRGVHGMGCGQPTTAEACMIFFD